MTTSAADNRTRRKSRGQRCEPAGRITDVQTHKRASAADQRKRSKAEGTWVRYAVYVKSGPNSGYLSCAPSRLKIARTLCEVKNEAGYADKWAIARIEIHAGCPDPLRRK